MLEASAGASLALLDWELATLGDPLADLGYLVATWSDAGSPGTVLELSPVTRREGFPVARELVDRYAERSGREVDALAWYETLALWKAAVFCEGLLRPPPARRDGRRLVAQRSPRACRGCCAPPPRPPSGASVLSRKFLGMSAPGGRSGGGAASPLMRVSICKAPGRPRASRRCDRDEELPTQDTRRYASRGRRCARCGRRARAPRPCAHRARRATRWRAGAPSRVDQRLDRPDAVVEPVAERDLQRDADAVGTVEGHVIAVEVDVDWPSEPIARSASCCRSSLSPRWEDAPESTPRTPWRATTRLRGMPDTFGAHHRRSHLAERSALQPRLGHSGAGHSKRAVVAPRAAPRWSLRAAAASARLRTYCAAGGHTPVGRGRKARTKKIATTPAVAPATHAVARFSHWPIIRSPPGTLAVTIASMIASQPAAWLRRD